MRQRDNFLLARQWSDIIAVNLSMPLLMTMWALKTDNFDRRRRRFPGSAITRWKKRTRPVTAWTVDHVIRQHGTSSVWESDRTEVLVVDYPTLNKPQQKS